MKRGAQIAEGLTAELFAVGEAQVLKLFRAGFPREYVAHELAITNGARAAGLPVPAVAGDVVEMGGRFGFVQERVAGFSLMGAWVQNAAGMAEAVGRMLAELHTAVHDVHAVHATHERMLPAEVPLPSQQEWLHNNIVDAPELDERLKEKAIALLAELAADAPATQLCHGDFHPGNILCRPKGEAVVIDWFTAVRGAPAADVARTRLLLTQTVLPAGLAIGPAEREALCAAYTESYVEARPLPRLADWDVVLVAASLCEDFFGERAGRVAWLQERLAG